MKNNVKRLTAQLLAAAMLLSVSACAKTTQSGVQTPAGSGAEAVAENVIETTTRDYEKIIAEIKQETSAVSETLEVNKIYDELPVTAKIVGIERVAVEVMALHEDGSADDEYHFSIYADFTDPDNIICSLPNFVGDPNNRVWGIYKSNGDAEIYLQVGEKFVDEPEEKYFTDDFYLDGISQFYDIPDEIYFGDELHELDYTYLGKEPLIDYEETLVFEAKSDSFTIRYNVDPVTGFWVAYRETKTVYDESGNATETFLSGSYIKSIELEPAEQTPDIKNNLTSGK